METTITIRSDRPNDAATISDVVLRASPIALPFEDPDENCMILPLTARALDGVAGTVRYADSSLNH